MRQCHSLLRAILPIFVVLAATSGSFPACQAFVVGGVGKKGAARTSPLQAASSSLTKSTKSSSPQLLEFREPSTGVLVKLIGCMHYNPASIQLTTDTINELARENRLGSVVIESCDIRWNQTKTLAPAVQSLLMSEMKAACDLALEDYQRPVVLGDQRINITVASMKQGLKETLTDLTTPWSGGWGRYWSNVTMAREEALPFGGSYLNAFAFLDPKLLLAAPVSLIKYPLSYFFKAPLQTTAFFALLFAVDQPPSEAATLLPLMGDSISSTTLALQDWVGSFAVSGLEIAFFARIFLKELLMQRNKLLARNILEQCKLYQSTTPSASSSPPKPFWNIFDQTKRPSAAAAEVVYVEGPGTMTRSGPGDDKAVVAVLGMAHCNGIMKLLQDQKV